MKSPRRHSIRNQRSNKLILVFLNIIFLLLVGFICSDAWIEFNAKGRIFNNPDDIPENKVGVVLGTSKYSANGQNLFYLARINAAFQLYDAGKIEYILISGDNATKYYNEPKLFREDLIKLGVPSDRIVLDYAGFRTLDSVVRSKEVFQLEKVTIISQQFHNERALFIADNKGLEAIAYNAKNVGGEKGLGIKLRERFARVKMLWDLATNKQPKFLGEEIQIGQ